MANGHRHHHMHVLCLPINTHFGWPVEAHIRTHQLWNDEKETKRARPSRTNRTAHNQRTIKRALYCSKRPLEKQRLILLATTSQTVKLKIYLKLPFLVPRARWEIPLQTKLNTNSTFALIVVAFAFASPLPRRCCLCLWTFWINVNEMETKNWIIKLHKMFAAPTNARIWFIFARLHAWSATLNSNFFFRF